MEETKVYDLTPTIGACGRFQVAIVTAIHSTNVVASWGMLYMVFGLYNPGWACLDKEVFNISSTSNVTFTPYLQVTDQFNVSEWSSDCEVKAKCTNILYNQESSTMVSQWGLSCDNLAWVPSFTVSIQMTGVLLGSYFSGQIGDKLGRKIAIYGHLAFHGISHLLAIFSVSWYMNTAMLFLIGFNVGGILTVAFPFPLEFLSERWRGIYAALPLWNIGATLFATTVFILKDWRHIHIATAVISGLSCLTVFWTPESVRWLTVSGRVDRAKQAVAKIAAFNGRPCPNTSVIDDISMEEKSKMGGHKYTYIDVFKIRSIRGHSIKFGLIWIIMAISYYVISFGVKALSGNFYVNFVLFSVFDLPAMLTVAPAMNKLGRRLASLIYFGIATLCAFAVIIVFFLAHGSVKDMFILVLVLICKGVIVAAWSVVAVFSSELYPTVVRSLHYGYLNAISRIGAIIAPYLIANDPDSLYVPFIILGILLCVNCVLTYSLPETKGQILPDRAKDDDL